MTLAIEKAMIRTRSFRRGLHLDTGQTRTRYDHGRRSSICAYEDGLRR